MPNRREFLRAGGLWTAALLAGCHSLTGRSSSRPAPNILFIMSDDHDSHAIGCYGSKINQTPNIDRLAREGMLFQKCFCTNSVCSPSRAVILTGKYSHLNGKIDNRGRFDNTQQTIPKLLRQDGYQTAVIGKWHLESDPAGFDFWRIVPGQGNYYNPDFLEMDGSRKKYDGYCTDLITDFALNWLEQRDPGKPFFLMAHHKAPHRNWTPPARHFGRYKLGTVSEPATLFTDRGQGSAAAAASEMSLRRHFSWGHDMKFKGENLFPQQFTSGMANGEYARMKPEQKQQWDAYYEPENRAFIEQMQAGKLSDEDVLRWKYQRYMHDYLGCVAAVDDSVGRLLDYLQEKELAGNTIVVYTSDQGFYLGDFGWFDKRFMYEDSLRMPLLMRWPQTIKPGAVTDAMALNLDFGPTFLNAANVPIPADIQGESMLPILKGHTPSNWRQAMYYHYYEFPSDHMVKRHYGIRTERYKLIHFYYDIDAWELYDLQTDPLELTNLYDNPQYADLIRRLKTQLEKLRARYGDSDELTQSFLPPKS